MLENIAQHFVLINKLTVFLINAIGLELAFWVYFINRKQRVNKLFLFFTLCLIVWVDFDFLGTFAPFLFAEADVVWVTLIATRIIFAFLCPFFLFLYFFSVHTLNPDRKPKIMEVIQSVAWTVLLALSFTDLIVADVAINPIDPIATQVIPGRFLIFYLIFAVFSFAISLLNLAKKYAKMSSATKKKFSYILAALSLFGIFNIIFNVVIPAYWNVYPGQISLIGDYSIILLLAFAGYLIIKERLFGIKIILTEILIGLMGAILAIMPFLIDVLWQRILLALLFFLFCIFSYLLIKSTIREYREKELLEHQVRKRTQELESAKKNLEELNTVLEIRVAARTAELEKLNQTLEEKVKERTTDLRQKISDLEKFQKLTVGRELKMIELKKEIETQKTRVKQLEAKKGKSDLKLKAAVAHG
ncbi:MAG TPA: hypothetical protein P5080_04335 [Candidatus Paceibacterota bacterium]|nr:hypothetical protein [Candidatus Pacearchaeota archaeon]HRZ51181.1 hypothetical protein [Candidatus Paceibacterota bacterium]HSA36902.1 hypothetical protein [Candidatus Paceibacterota bacterium]